VIPCDAIAPAEAFLERALLIARDVGMAEGVVAIDIRVAMMFIVIASGLDAVAEAIAANIIVAIGKRIPGAASYDDRRRTVGRAGVCEVGDGDPIAAHKALAICLAEPSGDTRMTVFEAIIGIGATVICNVFAGGFDSFVKAAALNVVPRVVRPIPIVTILSEAGSRRRWREGLNARCREQQEYRTAAERCDAKPVEIHQKISFSNLDVFQLSDDLSNEC